MGAVLIYFRFFNDADSTEEVTCQINSKIITNCEEVRICKEKFMD